MIIPLADDKYANRYMGHYLVLLNKRPESRAFLRRCKAAPRSYAAKIATGVWDSLFNRSLDLRREYSLYLGEEYPTFSDYLTKNYHFAAEIRDQANVYYNQFQSIYYYKPYQGFLHEEEGFELLSQLLRGYDRK